MDRCGLRLVKATGLVLQTHVERLVALADPASLGLCQGSSLFLSQALQVMLLLEDEDLPEALAILDSVVPLKQCARCRSMK